MSSWTTPLFHSHQACGLFEGATLLWQFLNELTPPCGLYQTALFRRIAALDTFRPWPRRSLLFCRKDGIEPSIYRFQGGCLTIRLLCVTHREVPPLSLHILLDTEYDTPHGFHLPTTYRFFKICDLSEQTPNLSNRIAPLFARLGLTILPFPVPNGRLVLCWGQHHLLLSVCLSYPLRLLNKHSFQHNGFLASSIRFLDETYLAVPSRLSWKNLSLGDGMCVSHLWGCHQPYSSKDRSPLLLPEGKSMP